MRWQPTSQQGGGVKPGAAAGGRLARLEASEPAGHRRRSHCSLDNLPGGALVGQPTAHLGPFDRSGRGRIALSRSSGTCAGPMVLSAVGTWPPHDGSSRVLAFQCGSRGLRAAAARSTEWPYPRPGRDVSTHPKDGCEPMDRSDHHSRSCGRHHDVTPLQRKPLPS